MPSPFQGIETASRALHAFQRSLDTTGHNIANVNTVGYSRQTVGLEATLANNEYGNRLVSIGSGVNVTQVNRIRDAMIEARRQDAYSSQGRAEGNLGNLEKVQSIFLDVQGKGISTALDTFFNSWSALGSSPGNAANLLQVQSAGRDLAGKISSTYSQLKAQSDSQTTQVTQTISQIQSLADKIEKLNKQIRQEVAQGGSPNDLFDQRDDTIADLSKLVNINTSLGPDGTTSVFVGSFTLVDQVGSRQFPTTFNTGGSTVTDAVGTWDITGGKLKGLFDSANQTTGYMSQLDDLANSLRTQVNSIHSAAYSAAGTTGNLFFNDAVPQTGAANFALDAGVDANPSNIAIGNTSASGDSSAALALSALRNTSVAALGNRSLSTYFNDLVSTVGRDVSVAKNNVSTANALSEQIDAQIQDVSGVNLDDEMSNMLKFQRSYQAAAKVLNMMDQMMGDLIGMLNR